jgi:hypothetical protein
MKKITLGSFAVLSSLLAAAAIAGDIIVVDPPVSVPEPGTLGLLAMGVAGVVAAARLGRRK